MRERPPSLSKSRYISGLQCHLRLWNDCCAPDEASEVDHASAARFAIGHEVGALATKRHEGGLLIDADRLSHEECVAKTMAAMADSSVPAIFEASFLQENVRVRADILARGRAGRWHLVEVKSATKVKDVNLDDLAIQYWVLKKAGVEIGKAGILTLNTDYVYAGGDYDLEKLFSFHELAKEVAPKGREVAKNVRAMHTMLGKRQPPKVEVGDHCFQPYDCPYYDRCTKHLKVLENPVEDLPALSEKKRSALTVLGVETIEDVPSDFPLSPMQQRVHAAVIGGDEFISPELGVALQEPMYPIHHLDFETVMFALPRYASTRPYQTLPFQWSNHIETASGRLRHEEYLCQKDVDPREAFAASLLQSLGGAGTICIYSGYEIRIIRELAKALPKFRRRLLALQKRSWDLHGVIREHFYHPKFHGSFSLKRTLPVLVPKMSYEKLSVQDGEAASLAYVELIATADAKRRRALRKSLLEYCRQDTLAMVELRRALKTRNLRREDTL